MGQGKTERIDTGGFDTAISEVSKVIQLFGQAKSFVDQTANIISQNWAGFGEESFEKFYRSASRMLKDEEKNLNNFRSELEVIKATYEGWDKAVSQKLGK